MEHLGKAFLGAAIATFIGHLIDGWRGNTMSETIEHYGLRFVGYFVLFSVIAYFWGKKKTKIK